VLNTTGGTTGGTTTGGTTTGGTTTTGAGTTASSPPPQALSKTAVAAMAHQKEDGVFMVVSLG
jgi:hypothetical protein